MLKKNSSTKPEKHAQNKIFIPRWVSLFFIVVSTIVLVTQFFILTGFTFISPTYQVTIYFILISSICILCLFYSNLSEIFSIVKYWRTKKAASELRIRLVTFFSSAAVTPALFVAIIAIITLRQGLDRWFDKNTREIVSSSVNLANAYVLEALQNLQNSSYIVMIQLDYEKTALSNIDKYNKELTWHARQLDLKGIFLLDKGGKIIAHSLIGKEKTLPIPPKKWILEATETQPLVFQPGAHDYFGVVFKVRNAPDLYFYTVNDLDKHVLNALRLTELNTDRYHVMERNRVVVQVAFALIYICFFLIMLLIAIWAGISVADRFVGPIRFLISAANNIAQGNYHVTVPDAKGDMGVLTQTFNGMSRQLLNQRNELVFARDQIDEKRRFSEAVLTGITSGVICIDQTGRIVTANCTAEEMFGFKVDDVLGGFLNKISFQLGQVFNTVCWSNKTLYHETIKVTKRDAILVYHVKITLQGEKCLHPIWVVTIDDITDLIAAQRVAAWSDVARRIAHEIKNPLTPIQLAAERIQKRYSDHVKGGHQIIEQCVQTIIRQVTNIGHMVDEFSSFARMPTATLQNIDIITLIKETVLLFQLSQNNIKINLNSEKELMALFDPNLIVSAFTNLIKNAIEAIENRRFKDPQAPKGEILITAIKKENEIFITIMDNGIGFPKKNRNSLLEPYVTTREKGTGLGLAIVKKVVEEHNGRLNLKNTHKNFYDGIGALVELIFPIRCVKRRKNNVYLEGRKTKNAKYFDYR